MLKWLKISASIGFVVVVLYILYKYNLQKTSTGRNTNTNNYQAIARIKTKVQNGDIIFRSGADAISKMFVGMNQQDKSYSHCGICFTQDTNIIVYHSIGGEDNPDAKIRKETLEQFCNPMYNLAIGLVHIPLPINQVNALQFTCNNWYKQHRTFDMDFNLQTDTQLYCVEFVAKAFNAATSKDSFFATSYIKTKKFRYYAPDNVLTHSAAQKIDSATFSE